MGLTTTTCVKRRRGAGLIRRRKPAGWSKPSPMPNKPARHSSNRRRVHAPALPQPLPPLQPRPKPPKLQPMKQGSSRSLPKPTERMNKEKAEKKLVDKAPVEKEPGIKNPAEKEVGNKDQEEKAPTEPGRSEKMKEPVWSRLSRFSALFHRHRSSESWRSVSSASPSILTPRRQKLAAVKGGLRANRKDPEYDTLANVVTDLPRDKDPPRNPPKRHRRHRGRHRHRHHHHPHHAHP